MTKIKNFPTPVAGLALGISAIGWCWENYAPHLGLIQNTTSAIALLLVCGVMAKFIRHPTKLFEELRHPIVGSVLPTMCMALMAISYDLIHFHQLAITGRVVWYGAVILHLLFFISFTYHRCKGFKLKDMIPSWFIPAIGPILGCLANPGADTLWLANILLVLGVGSYFVLLPLLMYRLTFHERLQAAEVPTFAIMAAPSNLIIIGYLGVATAPMVNMLLMLSGVAILLNVVFYLSLVRLLKQPFSAGFSAYTFPLASGATAMFKMEALLTSHELSNGVGVFHYLAIFQLYVASLIIAYVAFCFIKHYRFNLIGLFVNRA
ncbi:TDT family transporter [Vibrio algicola]|uniref:C4-dicarboxylate ABC transporter n=1 Tax=Vibrio algicola TaxID=2662262 RepID=A0A5Q0TLF4_9VIBR|nr:TDT family transporter [Vibrio algicola]